MEKMRLGKTGLILCRTGFGALPIQRVNFDDARLILRKAFDNGINFFDTARGYTDSEEKIGNALSDVRKEIIIATKTPARNKNDFFKNLETSLKKLKTDYIDVYQLHNPDFIPYPGDPSGLYEAMTEAREKGMIRFLGITNHRIDLALKAAESGLFDTIQFPLSHLSSKKDLELIGKCREFDVGLIAMKALSGGLITNAAASFAFLRQFDNVIPIWGIQREAELDEFIELESNPPVLDNKLLEIIENDRKELSGDFCRGCGYCMPCPAGIPIPTAARMSLLLRRSPYQRFLEDDWKEKMEGINNCINCGQCRKKCPYELDTPAVLKKMLADYRDFYSSHNT